MSWLVLHFGQRAFLPAASGGACNTLPQAGLEHVNRISIMPAHADYFDSFTQKAMANQVYGPAYYEPNPQICQ
jgi:hypothetical protein